MRTFAVVVVVALVTSACAGGACPDGFDREGALCIERPREERDGAAEAGDGGPGAPWGADAAAVLPTPDGGTIAPCSGSAEACNGVDDDCDGAVDEGLTPSIFYGDGDADGFGAHDRSVAACAAPAGFVANDDDCDDGCAACAPGAAETCDTRDEDCDGRADEGALSTFWRDADLDGHGDARATIQACAAPSGYVTRGDDCDDNCPTCHPGAAESCNARDDDCDDAPDDSFACVLGSAGVACTTSCGSRGTGTCTAACGAPVAAACAPPAESCDGADDDCDGRTDEGVQVLGPRRDLAGAGGGLELVRAGTGIVAVYARGAGIAARRFDASGAPVGGEVVVTSSAGELAAASTGHQVIIAWLAGERMRGAVLRADLTTITAPRDLATVSDFANTVRVVVSGTSALVVYRDSDTVVGLPRVSPSLAERGAPVVIARGTSTGMDLALDPTGSRAYLAYVDRASTDLFVRPLTLAGAGTSTVTRVTVDAIPQAAPILATGNVAGRDTLFAGWHHDPTGTASDRLAARLYSISLDGSLMPLDSVDVLVGAPPTSVGAVHDVALSGGRWVVGCLRQSGGATRSIWTFAEITQQPAGAPTIARWSAESAASENRHVSIVAGAGGVLTLGASRTDGADRLYTRGCF